MWKWLLVLCAAATAAQACDLCAIYTAAAGRDSRPGWSAGVFEQFSNHRTLREDGKRISNPADQRMESSITQLALGYEFNNRFGVQLNVPFIYRGYKRPSDTGSEGGLGDVALTAHYRVLRDFREDSMVLLDVIGGVKFPTGNSRRLREEIAADHHHDDHEHEHEHDHDEPVSGVHGHDLALGSGSFDGVVGLAGFGSWRRWFVTASVQYSIRSEGDFDYRYANDLLWNVAPGYFVVARHDRTFGVQFSVSGEAKGKDTVAGRTAQDTGIVSVYVGPAVRLTWRDRLGFEAALDVPLLQETTDVQIVPDYRVRAGLSVRF